MAGVPTGTSAKNGKPKQPLSDEVMAAALAALPAGGSQLDEDVLPPDAEVSATGSTPADASAPLEYLETDPGDQPAAPAQGASQPPAAPAAGTQAALAGQASAQPPALVTPPTPAGQQAVVKPGDGSDPWAETEDIEYDDGDTGEKFVVRAPKTYSDKVRNGYARRSIMDRASSYLGQHRKVLEPLITSNQIADIVPLIERGVQDREFANFIAAAYTRRLNGLPLEIQQAPQQQVSPQTRQAPTNIVPAEQILASIDAITDVDDYTKNAFKALAAPLANTIIALQTELASTRQTTQTQQEQQAQRQRQFQAEQQQGRAYRTALQQTFPDQFTEQTPREEYMRVYDYAVNAGLFNLSGRSSGTIVLAAQALRNPNGMRGLAQPQAGSAAASAIAGVRAQGEALAAQAAAGVAQQVNSGAPAGAAPPAAPAPKPKPPRFVRDRNGKVRPISPMEAAAWLEKHPGVYA